MKRYVIALLILTAHVSAEDDKKMTTGDGKTDAVMVEIQKLVREIDRCAGTQTTVIRIHGQELTLRANAAFKRPNLMRLDTVEDTEIIAQRLSDGGLMWTYSRAEKIVSKVNLERVYRAVTALKAKRDSLSKVNLGRVYRLTALEADADQADPLRPFRGLEWTTIRYTGDEIFDDQPHRVFEAKPKVNLLHAQLPIPLVKAQLTINAETGLLRATRLFDASDNEIIAQTFHNLTVNPDLKDTKFEFIVPSGAHIIDATDEAIQALKAVE